MGNRPRKTNHDSNRKTHCESRNLSTSAGVRVSYRLFGAGQSQVHVDATSCVFKEHTNAYSCVFELNPLSVNKQPSVVTALQYARRQQRHSNGILRAQQKRMSTTSLNEYTGGSYHKKHLPNIEKTTVCARRKYRHNEPCTRPYVPFPV